LAPSKLSLPFSGAYVARVDAELPIWRLIVVIAQHARIYDGSVTIDELESSAVNDPDGIIGTQSTMIRYTALGVADSRGILNVAYVTNRLGKGESFDDSSILEFLFLALAGNHLLSPRALNTLQQHIKDG